jgi:hypothetical protein
MVERENIQRGIRLKLREKATPRFFINFLYSTLLLMSLSLWVFVTPPVEAEKCLAVGAYNACGTMTRRAMHSLCSDKNAGGSDLYAQLKFLKDNHLITPGPVELGGRTTDHGSRRSASRMARSSSRGCRLCSQVFEGDY